MNSQNNERPDQAIARLLKDDYQSFTELIFESGKQQDSIAAWLVGLSTGSIALMISQFGKFDPVLYPTLKVSVLFLTGTIIFGLVFRIVHLYLQERERVDFGYIIGWLSGHGESSTEVLIDLPEDSSAEFIASYLYNRMGIDMTPEFRSDIRTKNDVQYWRKEYEKTAQLYHRLNESEHKMRINMFEDFESILATLDGRPPRKYEPIGERDISAGIRKRRVRKTCTLSYLLMCISFGISVLIISAGFIKTDLQANQATVKTNQGMSTSSKHVRHTHIDKSD